MWCERHSARASCLTTNEIGLDNMELAVLTDSMLAPHSQERPSHLLQLNREGSLDAEEERELDHLLEWIDQMNLLKARAVYTARTTRTGEQS